MREQTTPVAPDDERLLRLAEGDNVLIVTELIEDGESFSVSGRLVTATGQLPTGFKVAAADLAPGDLAIRLATPIGRATRAIEVGQLVHTHNLASQYLRTHDRGEA